MDSVTYFCTQFIRAQYYQGYYPVLCVRDNFSGPKVSVIQPTPSPLPRILLCFAGWLSECTVSHTAQNNTLWSNVEYSHHRICIFLLCGVSLHALAACSLTTNLQSTISCVVCKGQFQWPQGVCYSANTITTKETVGDKAGFSNSPQQVSAHYHH